MNSFEEKSARNYNAIADDYDNSFEGKYTERFKKLLLEEVKPKAGDTVLDVACGNGTFLKMLADKWDIIGKGVDISEKMIVNARQKAPDMTFEVAKCDAIPFGDGSVDIITVSAAYHHFPNVKSFAKETYRLLKQGGRMYIAEIYYPAFVRLMLNPFVPLLKAGDVKFYSPKNIIRNFESSGFSHDETKIVERIQIVILQKNK